MGEHYSFQHVRNYLNFLRKEGDSVEKYFQD